MTILWGVRGMGWVDGRLGREPERSGHIRLRHGGHAGDRAGGIGDWQGRGGLGGIGVTSLVFSSIVPLSAIANLTLLAGFVCMGVVFFIVRGVRRHAKMHCPDCGYERGEESACCSECGCEDAAISRGPLLPSERRRIGLLCALLLVLASASVLLRQPRLIAGVLPDSIVAAHASLTPPHDPESVGWILRNELLDRAREGNLDDESMRLMIAKLMELMRFRVLGGSTLQTGRIACTVVTTAWGPFPTDNLVIEALDESGVRLALFKLGVEEYEDPGHYGPGQTRPPSPNRHRFVGLVGKDGAVVIRLRAWIAPSASLWLLMTDELGTDCELAYEGTWSLDRIVSNELVDSARTPKPGGG